MKSGQVHGMTAGRHTSKEFVSFLTGWSNAQLGQGDHVVLDSLSAHKTKDVETFLAKHP